MLAEAPNIAVEFAMIITCTSLMRMLGGPIDLGLTGEVAQILMVWWDQQLIKKLDANGMRVLLYLRYVDDNY